MQSEQSENQFGRLVDRDGIVVGFSSAAPNPYPKGGRKTGRVNSSKENNVVFFAGDPHEVNAHGTERPINRTRKSFCSGCPL